jgi:two-component system phosphate regulon sensor histidine kinase PhoR
MSSATLQRIVAAATILIVLVMCGQLYWLKKTYTLEEKEFNIKVHGALRSVIEEIRYGRRDMAAFAEVIEQPKPNYFIANIKYEADSDEVEFLLKKAFEEYNVFTTFKFGLYNKRTGQMNHIRYIRSAATGIDDSSAVLPVLRRDYNYIGVLFPNRQSFILHEMDFWIFSTLLLLLIIIGFAVSIFKLFRQRQLAEIQKDFINNMTHEFRTPIATIQLSTEVFKNSPVIQNNQRLFQYANIIENEANHLEEQAERVLQVANMQKNALYLKKEAVDVHETILRCISDFEENIRKKKGHFELKLAASRHIITADKLHFTNILFNLIDNAIKYSKIPEVTILTADHNNGMSVSVRDNGIGIPRHYQKFLFTKFFRVPTGNLHEVKGFGLGLNYVKLYTKAFGGSIQVESDPGKGSIFTLYFPKAVAESDKLPD